MGIIKIDGVKTKFRYLYSLNVINNKYLLFMLNVEKAKSISF